VSESSQSCPAYSTDGGKGDRLLVLYLLNGDLARLILNEVPISFCSDHRFLQAKMWDLSRVYNTGLLLRQGRDGSKSRASLPGSAELSRPR
jgi:hypothetical protein